MIEILYVLDVIDKNLLSWRKSQPHTISHHAGQDGLEAKSQESVEAKDKSVAVLTDVAGDLKTGHSDHHLVEGPEHDVAGVAHGDGGRGGHEVQHQGVHHGDDGKGQLSND